MNNETTNQKNGKYHPDVLFKKKFYNSAKRWNKYQSRIIPEDQFEEIITKVDRDMDDLCRLTLDLAEYRFSQHTEWNHRQTLQELNETHPTIIPRDFDSAVKIRFLKLPTTKTWGESEKKGMGAKSLKGGKRPEYDKDLFQKVSLRQWLLHHTLPFYRSKIYVHGEVVDLLQEWMGKRFTYLSRKWHNQPHPTATDTR